MKREQILRNPGLCWQQCLISPFCGEAQTVSLLDSSPKPKYQNHKVRLWTVRGRALSKNTLQKGIALIALSSDHSLPPSTTPIPARTSNSNFLYHKSMQVMFFSSSIGTFHFQPPALSLQLVLKKSCYHSFTSRRTNQATNSQIAALISLIVTFTRGFLISEAAFRLASFNDNPERWDFHLPSYHRD